MNTADNKLPVVYIVGPTAVGKTGLSISLAEKFGGEIISGDSMQIYKGMHIASAAPDENEKGNIKHHLFEFLDMDKEYSVSNYVEDAGKVIKDIHLRGKLPFVVGGTGLYINSLAENIFFGDDKKNPVYRAELEKRADICGLFAMYEYLLKTDSETAKKISPNDRKRILRAIEVYETTGKTMSQRVKESHCNPSEYNNIFIGLAYKNRELLYERINRRVDVMLDSGLLKEAEKAYLNVGATASQAIGHKEFFEYFKGNEDLNFAVERLKQQTRRYAKRQMTWFRKNENINWIYMDEEENCILTASNIIKNNLQ